VTRKIGRNEACPCGSGKKYKKCCQQTEKQANHPVLSPLVIKKLQSAIGLHQQGELSAAKSIYEEVLEIDSINADALHYLGLIYYQTGDSQTAVTFISKAIHLTPTSLMHCNLGAALQAQGRHNLAIEHYQTAITLQPDYAEAYNNLGAAFQEQGRLTEAISSFQQALSLNADYASAHNNLGNAFLVQGKLQAALACYRRSLRVDADNLSTHSNLLMALSYYPLCTNQQYLEEARLYGAKVLAKATPYTQWPLSLAHREQKRLRIGLVSGDLQIHPVGYFLESVLAQIDPAKIELFAYAAQLKEDRLTQRIKPFFSEWQVIYGLSDKAVAQKIYESGIDILIDLSGHTSGNRLSLFAWKSAPVQVSWLGYFASTGVPGIDYLLTDEVSVPEAKNQWCSEQVWLLPETRLCFTPPDTTLIPSILPAIDNQYITFACFQNLSKINEAVINAWGLIFKALPTAKLVLRNKQMSCLEERTALQKRLSVVGISTEQVKIEGLIAREDYLAAYSSVDIMLDTFPYPGGTTTCEALWMGVPTLTLLGNTLLARQGASLLTCVGLQDWVANDKNAYVAQAIHFATDIRELALLREGLRNKVIGTALFDASKFSKQFENAMLGMWEQSLAVYALPPTS